METYRHLSCEDRGWIHISSAPVSPNYWFLDVSNGFEDVRQGLSSNAKCNVFKQTSI